jgi:undecaprenyl-diphosphatase
MTSCDRSIISLLLIIFLACATPLQPPDVLASEGPAAAEKGSGGMTHVQAAILGIVEGVTEYLPVSSTGHLLLAERIMGIGKVEGATQHDQQGNKDAADAYAICIQAGAIIAVLGLYFRRVKQMGLGVVGKDPEGLRMLINLAAGFLPAALLGFILHRTIKTYLFGPWPIIAAWLAGGLGILWIERRRKRSNPRLQRGAALSSLNVRMALVIGLAQCIAMWPGVSRSLTTILGGVMVGLSMPAAVEFSFLLGVVTLGAATLFDALKHGREMLQTFGSFSLALGLITAFLSAVVSVKWMVAYLNQHGLEIFGYYRIGIAVIAALLMAGGWI